MGALLWLFGLRTIINDAKYAFTNASPIFLILQTNAFILYLSGYGSAPDDFQEAD
ncbi:MAG: hypothetical protein IT311_11480 [Anaerolineales bacterium]|nr:hypothetical protein [Anaerolineales bacterium]MCZ2121810.1 hypothetical protein [Anaerolineales bacterium]